MKRRLADRDTPRSTLFDSEMQEELPALKETATAEKLVLAIRAAEDRTARENRKSTSSGSKSGSKEHSSV